MVGVSRMYIKFIPTDWGVVVERKFSDGVVVRDGYYYHIPEEMEAFKRRWGKYPQAKKILEVEGEEK